MTEQVAETALRILLAILAHPNLKAENTNAVIVTAKDALEAAKIIHSVK